MKLAGFLVVVVALATCGPSTSNDPIYKRLKANPPTAVPRSVLPKLQADKDVCTVYNTGQRNQYMTCWWVVGVPPQQTYLTYFPPNPLSPPTSRGTPVYTGITVSKSILIK